MVRWQAAGPSGEGRGRVREVMLRAEGPEEMTSWLTAITDESTRTQQRPVVDWWSELFGEVTFEMCCCCLGGSLTYGCADDCSGQQKDTNDYPRNSSPHE